MAEERDDGASDGAVSGGGNLKCKKRVQNALGSNFPCNRPAKYLHLHIEALCGIHARRFKGSKNLVAIKKLDIDTSKQV